MFSQLSLNTPLMDKPPNGKLPVPSVHSFAVLTESAGESGGLVVNASDSGSRGRGFEPHSGQTVFCP